MGIVANDIDYQMSEGQIGGVKRQYTRDHITTITSLLRVNEAKSKPTSITLVDLISCFDKIHINDVTYDMCCVFNRS